MTWDDGRIGVMLDLGGFGGSCSTIGSGPGSGLALAAAHSLATG